MASPRTEPEAREAEHILLQIGASRRLIRHGELVAEAAEQLLAVVAKFVAVDARLVRLGAHLHDAGKSLHPNELDGAGSAHEDDGEAILLRHGLEPRVARICRTHARWRVAPEITIEDLLVALADSLWKGRRDNELEQRVIDAMARRAGAARWDFFVPLDDAFERIAAGGEERLARSRT